MPTAVASPTALATRNSIYRPSAGRTMSIGPSSAGCGSALRPTRDEVGQRQHDHADHGQEHAEVERHGGGELDLADQRQVEIVVAAGEERQIADTRRRRR